MERATGRMLITAGILSFVLALIIVPRLKAANPKDSDIFVQVLGGTTEVAASAAYEEADTYFHAGISGGCPDEHEDACKEHEKQTATSHGDLPLKSVVEYLSGETAPRKHVHLEAADEKELLPWFTATVRLNPHHIEAWRTGAYWYYRTGNADQAVEFISQGIRSNPGDYRVYLERGMLYHRLRRWSEAVRDFDTAQHLFKAEGEEAVYDRKAIEIYRKDAQSHLPKK